MPRQPFTPDSYWERRYAKGGDSGAGSQGKAAKAKAKYLTDLIDAESPVSILDLGCGDGNVVAELEAAGDTTPYIGADLSATILDANRARFATAGHRRWLHADQLFPMPAPIADLAISADVLHHFPDPADMWTYLARLFASSGRLVAIYATDHDAGQTAYHCAWWHWTTEAADRFAGDGWELDAVQQGRRTKRESIDPSEPAWYLWRRTPSVEIPEPKQVADPTFVPPAAGGEPGSVGPMRSNPDLVPGGDPGKA